MRITCSRTICKFFTPPVTCLCGFSFTNGIRAGGVSIVGSGGKIDINNTLDERLRLLQDNALPAIRTTLFGANENRKFYD
jgi:hypothetical protein